ncbi:O-antigen ligase [Alteromonas sp. D210916BOD_24]|uniref:O-antigen ligase family protein n=1 Tax=Alteromonas sp. D210916BOD_24 TaxID=3157618 RepID=UPI00399C90A9
MLRSSTFSNKNTQWLFYLFLFTIFWAPIPLASNRPWAWGLLEIFCFAIAAGALIYYKNNVLHTLKDNKISIALFCIFTAWVALQQVPLPIQVIKLISPNAFELHALSPTPKAYATISLDPAQTTIILYKTLAYFGLFLSTLLIVNTEKRLKTVMLTIVFTGLFQALYGSLEVLLGFEKSIVFQLPVKGIATGTFVYKNHYANFLMLCLSIGVGYLVSTLISKQSSSKKARLRRFLETMLNGKAVVRIALAIMVIALVMSRSRMGNTAFFAAMTMVGLLALFLIKRRSKGLTILIVSMFVIDVFIVSAWFGLDKVKDRLENTTLTHETRDEVVRDSLPLLQDYAITGSGFGSFYSIFPSYQSEDIQIFYDHAHNDYLQFAIETGLIACLIIFLLPFIAIATAIKAMRQRQNSLMQGLAFGCTMAIVGMAIHMSVDFPLQAPANSVLFIVILALALLTNKRLKQA